MWWGRRGRSSWFKQTNKNTKPTINWWLWWKLVENPELKATTPTKRQQSEMFIKTLHTKSYWNKPVADLIRSLSCIWPWLCRHFSRNGNYFVYTFKICHFKMRHTHGASGIQKNDIDFTISSLPSRKNLWKWLFSKTWRHQLDSSRVIE